MASPARLLRRAKGSARGSAYCIEFALATPGDYTNPLQLAGTDGQAIVLETFDYQLNSATKNSISTLGVAVNRRIVLTLKKSVKVAVVTIYVASANTKWTAYNKRDVTQASVNFAKDDKAIHTAVLSGKGIVKLVGETTNNEGQLVNLCL
jgi:hypothetical protein